MADNERLIATLRAANAEMAEAESALGYAITALSDALNDEPAEPARRVWYVKVPEDAEWMLGELEVLIEQFGTNAPTVAFRRGGNPKVWGRPFRGELRRE